MSTTVRGELASARAGDGSRAVEPVAVIGGGLAGVTAAAALRRAGVPVVLFEAGKQLAGLAQTQQDDGGFTYDFGAHFITNRLAAAVGVEDACRTVRSYGESVRLGRRVYSYPFGLLRNPRFLTAGVAARARAFGRATTPPVSAADQFRATYGRALADAVAVPILEAWSGAPADDLSPAVVNKFQHSVAGTAWLKLVGKVTRRAIAVGYSHEKPEGPGVWHVYPEGGVSRLVHHLAVPVEDVIQRESPVEAIVIEDGRAVGVRVKGREQRVSAVISTAPVHALAKLVTGTDALGYLARFRYRPMIFVNLRLEGRGLLPDTMLWTPEAHYPFFRLTETPLSMPWLAPAGKTILTADLGCEVGDPVWRMSDDALAELCLDHLGAIVPGVRRRYLGARVLRTPIAYPVYLNAYEEDRQRFARGTGIGGLYSVGRNGEFAHILMEDVYWRTLAKVGEAMRAP